MDFSIVTVTRNNLNGLVRTAASVSAQTHPSFEWIVADGASTDGTVEWLKSHAPEFLSWKSEPDAGLYEAMNKAMGRASGEYLIFMNGGDTFRDATVLDDAVSLLRNSAIDLLYGDAYEQHDGVETRKRALSHHLVWYSMFTHHQAIFYRREAIGDLRYDTSFRIAADWAFTAGLLKSGARARRFARAICTFEQGGISQSPQHRLTAEKEHRRMHREILRLPLGLGHFAYQAKDAVNKLRRKWPRAYAWLRRKL